MKTSLVKRLEALEKTHIEQPRALLIDRLVEERVRQYDSSHQEQNGCPRPIEEREKTKRQVRTSITTDVEEGDHGLEFATQDGLKRRRSRRKVDPVAYARFMAMITE